MLIHIVLPGDRRIWLEDFRGVVIDASEAHVPVVEQGREQVQFIDNAALIRPSRVHSEIVSIHKVWLRNANGRESAHDLSDFPVDVRVGHSVALVYGAAEDREDGRPFGALNITTGQSAFDTSFDPGRLRPLGLWLPPKFHRKSLAWGLAVGVGTGLYSGWYFNEYGEGMVVSAVVGFVASLPFMLVRAIFKELAGRRLVSELNRRALAFLNETHSHEVAHVEAHRTELVSAAQRTG